MRVTHVNDVAHVGTTLVDTARRRNLGWTLWDIPTIRDRGRSQRPIIRALDVARFAQRRRKGDVLHIHYGLFGYYAAASRTPYVLHLHGSDVRINLQSPIVRHVVLRSIRSATHVVYSTPDLEHRVKAIRDDAEWLPAPVNLGTAGSSRRHEDLVLFGSRWDPSKGSRAIIKAVRHVATMFPKMRLVGVDWGIDAPLARRAGITLLPRMEHEDFRSLMTRATLVVGQLNSGALGVTELEAMLAQVPVVTSFKYADAYGSTPPIWRAATSQELIEAIGGILETPETALEHAQAGRSWVAGHHDPDVIVSRLVERYALIRTLGSHT